MGEKPPSFDQQVPQGGNEEMTTICDKGKTWIKKQPPQQPISLLTVSTVSHINPASHASPDDRGTPWERIGDESL